MFGTLSSAMGTSPASGACSCGPGRTCDGLECLCRPRYFAGQLLTDEDLRRLDHYIVAKNRLHNRYLHGTGVVCGLEVVCNPCDPTVTVRTGFAIGPCGEDIVVCADTSVDVAQLINAQRKKRVDDCTPYGGRTAVDCEAARQRWVLAICYEERPSRGVTSLRQKEWTSCGCSCSTCTGTANGHTNGNGNGGNGGDPCSCRQHHTTPAQCEPTVTCEGYHFVVYKEQPLRPVDPRAGGRTTGAGAFGAPLGGSALANGELGQRVQACLQEITISIQQLPSEATPEVLVEYCCQLKDDLRNVIESANVHDCMLGMRVSDILCPDVNDPDAAAKARQSILLLLQVAIDLYRSCVCSALLPPCPVDSPDDCVPLATLTVRTADLRVLDICNWSARRFAITFPTLGYWLGWLPIFDSLRAAITQLCCTTPRRPQFQADERLRMRATARAQPAANMAAAEAAGGPEATPPTEGVTMPEAAASPVTQLAAHYARDATPLSGLEATVLSALGAKTESDTPLAVPIELENPFAALALTRLAAPTLASTVPSSLTTLIADAVRTEPSAGRPTTPGSDTTDERVARLEQSVADLQNVVDSQSKTIATLRRQRPNR